MTDPKSRPEGEGGQKLRSLFSRAIAGLRGQHCYNPQQYWKKRHRRYGFDIRGVGNCALSAEENEQMYQQARDIFLGLCRDEKINFRTANVLDIGCGTGFYTDIVRSEGGKEYLGVDITDQLFPDLRKQFPGYSFLKADISEVQLSGTFDVIIMIDVTQHIVDNAAFFRAMHNIWMSLADGGRFIVTAWLSETLKERTFYEVQRPFEYYQKAFPDGQISKPIRFRDKYIFGVRK